MVTTSIVLVSLTILTALTSKTDLTPLINSALTPTAGPSHAVEITPSPTPEPEYLSRLNVSAEDKDILISLSEAIEKANSLFAQEHGYTINYTGDNNDEYEILSGQMIWDNIDKTIETYERIKTWVYERGGDVECISHYRTNSINTAYFVDDTCSWLNNPTQNFETIGQWKVHDVVDYIHYKTLYQDGKMVFSNFQKTTDGSGNTTYRFKLVVNDEEPHSNLFFDIAHADTMAVSGNYYFKFDQQGRVLNSMEQVGYGFNIYEYIY